ncbi:phosphate/phosphite/phosphonate ABC transporter substrate-binding protein [Methylomonas methanica]|uniref:Phosphonate transport system substrate-binding protein n=1 Tax=Methylomonas methanica TaxID=421 RepID=A0A177LTH3_METMH|nr:PhnD/SsuA/transferrin family substrate-binding protein [Methylomonas methanica]OAH96751.1 hypothetical protein A1332_04810 [Methylomonas methanica]
MFSRHCFALFIVVLFQIVGCDSSPSPTETYQPEITAKPAPSSVREYKFSAVPEGSQMRVLEVYGPVVDYLNAHIEGVKLILVAPKNHAEFEAGLLGRELGFAMTNAFQTVKSNEYGYHVIAKKADDDQFYGIILVRRDSGINNVSDLKGKKISYPTPNGVAATILPMWFLKSHGIDVFKDIENLYVGSHESSIMHVYLGKTAAGTAREFSWSAFQKAHPQEASALELKWRSEPLMDHAIIARNDIPKDLSDRIVELLVNLHASAAGQALLSAMSATKFKMADDASYDKARKFFMDNSDLIPSPLQRH